MDNDFLYEENILEHYRNPRNKLNKACTDCDCVGYAQNVDCGDSGELYLDLQNGRIQNVSWSGNGCALSQAGMSLMTEKIKDEKLSLEDLKLWTPAIIYELLKVKISPYRINCALLAYRCLTDNLKKLK